MKTAVLISGQLRTIARTWSTIRWHVLRHYPDYHLFICVQDTPEVQFVDTLRAELGAARVHIDARTDPDLSAHLTPLLAQRYHDAPYTNAAPAHQLLLQHHYQAEVWKFFCSLTEDTDHGGALSRYGFDTFIRLRGDLFFHDFAPPVCDALSFNTCHVPDFAGFGAINDRCAVMGEEAAAAYFNLWSAIPALLEEGCPFHPETLLLAQLERENVRVVRDLKTHFSTLRQNGDVRHWTRELLPSEKAA